jgi:hypothetical protein
MAASPRDDQALDFAGALADGHQAGIRVAVDALFTGYSRL